MSWIDSLLGPILKQVLPWQSRQSLPQTEGVLPLPGLSEPVEVRRDAWGVPHIFARHSEDVFFAQGFVQAQDRLWQMELNRRIGAGSLSEVLGPVALDTDRAIRTFGFAHHGAQAWDSCLPEVRSMIEHYVRGVNAFLTSRPGKFPIEFRLLGFEPRAWTTQDVLGFSQFMVWQMSHAWYGEVIRARVAQTVGPEAAAELEIELLHENPFILPHGIEFNSLSPDGGLQALEGPFLDRGVGSNAWVIANQRTESGRALLANDIHLSLTLPSTWYEMHLVSPTLQVAGASIPGLPMIMVGHNDRVGWGITLAFTDCEDLFVERFHPDQPLTYQTPEGWRPVEIREEKIEIKGQAPHVEKVLLTRHGPVISDLLKFSDARLAVQSMALRPTPVLNGWWALNHAENWNDFVGAMKRITAPQLSMTYVDVEGNIGTWVTGEVPVRKKGLGMVPAEGSTGEFDWVDTVPFAKMPHALNPKSGLLITCNQKAVPDHYPYFLGNSWMNGFRARRIHEVLSHRPSITVEDCRKLQMDFHCTPGRLFLERVRPFQPVEEFEQKVFQALFEWEGDLGDDTVGGTIYQVFRFNLLRRLFEPVLGEELVRRLMGQGFHPQLQFGNEFHGHDTVTLLRLLDKPDSWWIRQAGGKQQLLQESFTQSVQWLRATLGNEISQWRWGRIHHVTFRHAFSSKPLLARVFNRGPFAIGGDTDTPCQTSIAPEEPFACKAWAASYRQILDSGNWSNSIAVFPTGQSGQLGSPHYDDLLPLWLKGEYHPMLWTREEIEKKTAHLLELKPA